jgi:hypothetical protein
VAYREEKVDVCSFPNDMTKTNDILSTRRHITVEGHSISNQHILGAKFS